MNKNELHAYRWRSFERVLHYICQSIKPERILEWGPGRSTVVMLGAVPGATILTIEHDQKFYDAACARFGHDSRVEIQHRPISMKGGLSVGYVNYPSWRAIRKDSRLDGQYDLIFVDGRFRFDCLVAAWSLVKPRGVVVLHDAHRKNYLPAANLFKHSRLFAEMRTMVMSHSSLDFLKSFDPEKRVPDVVVDDAGTLKELAARFASKEPFTYLRFGDADLFFIADPNFDKNRRHDPNPAMSAELAKAFAIEHPDYLIGSSSVGGWHEEKTKRLQKICSVFPEGRRYYSAIALHECYMASAEKFVEFVKRAFWSKRVLFVGGESVCRAPLVRKAFGVTATIEFTDRNAYQMLDAKMRQIEKNISKFDVVISALGQCTRVLGGRLWLNGMKTQYFDVGSVVDALAERPLRSWIRNQPKKRLGEFKRLLSI